MRVNIYAEEMTDRVELIEKHIEGEGTFTGLRLYLHLPVTLLNGEQKQGPFLHRDGDDDSSAITFWGKQDTGAVLLVMLKVLEDRYGPQDDRLSYHPMNYDEGPENKYYLVRCGTSIIGTVGYNTNNELVMSYYGEKSFPVKSTGKAHNLFLEKAKEKAAQK